MDIVFMGIWYFKVIIWLFGRNFLSKVLFWRVSGGGVIKGRRVRFFG